MRILWTLFKIVVGAAILIPIGLLVAGLAFGLVATVVGLVVAAVRLALLGIFGYGLYRVVRHFLAPSAKPPRAAAPELPSVDPYYSAAMRELDAELRQ